MYVYYAVISAATTDAVTCHASAVTFIICGTLAVSNANTGLIFDPSASLPATGALSGTSITSGTFSTSYSNTLLFGFAACDGVGSYPCPSGPSAVITPQSGFTLNSQGAVSSACTAQHCLGLYLESEVVASSQCDSAAGVSSSSFSGDDGVIIVGAVVAGTSSLTPCTESESITVTTANSAPSSTLSLTNCSPSPSTIAADGTPHSVTVNEGCSLTVTVASDGANTRQRFSGGVSMWTFTTANNGGGSASNTLYYQVQNTYQASTNGNGPPNWDSGLSIPMSGTVAGAVSTVCNMLPSSGGTATASCTGWSDYGQTVSAPTDASGAAANIQWAITGTSSETPTTGGNTYSAFTYYKQLYNTYTAAATSPMTIGTVSSAQVTSTLGRQVWYSNSRYWVFTTATGYMSSTDGISWTIPAVSLSVTQTNTVWVDSVNNIVYIATGLGTAGAGSFRMTAADLFGNGDTLYLYKQNSIPAQAAGISTASTYGSIALDSAGNLWYAIGVQMAAGTDNVIIGECASGSNCGLGGSWSLKGNVQVAAAGAVNFYVSIIPLTSGKMALVSEQTDATGHLEISTYSGSAWSAVTTTTSQYLQKDWSISAIGDTIEFAGVSSTDSVVYWNCAYPCSSAPSETSLASLGAAGSASISTDGSSQVVVEYSVSGGSVTINYQVSANSGTSWGGAQVLASGEGVLNGGFPVLSYSKYNGQVPRWSGFLRLSGPFSRFASGSYRLLP